MKLEQLRKEFTLGNMLCRAHESREITVSVFLSQNFVGSIDVKLCTDGSLKVIRIHAVVDRGSSRQLVLIAQREKIPLELSTIPKPNSDTYPVRCWDIG